MTFDLRFWLLTLLAIAFCWPSEGAIQGDGLLWAAASCALAALASVYGYGASVFQLRRPSTWAVGLLLTGFVVSTGYVFVSGGDRRAALNLLAEWLSVVAIWYVVRIVVDELKQRRAIGQGLLVACFCVAAFGIVQHYILWPGQQNWYRQQTQTAAQGGIAGQRAEQRLRQLGVPAQAEDRQRFEARLMNSTEALGPFALANTLGGVLAVGCVLLAGAIVARQRSKLCYWNRFLLSVTALTIAWGLVLTKSRTAWIAASVGICIVVLRQKVSHGQQLLKWSVALTGTLIVVSGIAAFTGAIDREVIFESPKSLQYRLLYWAGTAEVIAESPWVGTGPGNFRETYLQHKWPETSEEILDPHNVFLDLWCSAGMLGLAGFLTMLWLVVCWGRSHKITSATRTTTAADSGIAFWKPILLAVIGVKSWDWIQGSPFWDNSGDPFAQMANLIWLLPLFAVAVSKFAGRLTIDRFTVAAAFATLVLHLCASGGMQITVMTFLLLVLFALAEPDADVRPLTVEGQIRYFRGAGFLIACVAILFFGLRQNLLRQFHLRNAASHGLNLSQADAEFDLAAASDPFAAESRQRQAGLHTYHLTMAAKDAARVADPDLEAFRKLVKTAQETCDRFNDQWPNHRSVHQMRSQISEAAFDVLKDDNLLSDAISHQRRLIQCYPSHVQSWFRFTELLSQKENAEERHKAAQRTIELEQINRNWGHSDRYLPSEDVEFLQTVLADHHEK